MPHDFEPSRNPKGIPTAVSLGTPLKASPTLDFIPKPECYRPGNGRIRPLISPDVSFRLCLEIVSPARQIPDMSLAPTTVPRILMASAECYPAAKVGGLADVVGSLPRYLNQSGNAGCAVVLPKYHNSWILQQDIVEKHYGTFSLGGEFIQFWIQYVVQDDLGYDLYVVHIPGKFDRPGVYGDHTTAYYRDEVERNLAFQRAVLHWVQSWDQLPDILHCHDHHTALMPFMMTHCPEYWRLAHTPTILTIHNAGYQGMFGWDRQHLLPDFPRDQSGLLDWGKVINSLACGIKCAWRVTTVSANYLRELQETYGFGLQALLRGESMKCSGIINGIDYDAWNPAKDDFLDIRLGKNADAWKAENKKSLLGELDMPAELPLHIFIGRMVRDKGIDFLAELIYRYLLYRRDATFLILGSGDDHLEEQCRRLERSFAPHVRSLIMYNERVAHRLYAAADFLWMPSRTEPCGLNQMYAMRYGAIPIARATGGLLDTIRPFDGEQGDGLLFRDLEADQGFWGIQTAGRLFADKHLLSGVRKRIMQKDLSWPHSASKYLDLYTALKPG